MSIRVLIADDQEVVRVGLASMLASPNIELLGTASSCQELEQKIQSSVPDLVILDVKLGGEDTLAVLGRMRQIHPNLTALILSAYDNPSHIQRAMALGARGYMLKDASREQIIDAVARLAQGEEVWTRDGLRRGSILPPVRGGDLEIPLTQRESEVLQQMALGLTNKEIAHSLHISYETVKEHVQHILRKLGVTDRTQAAVWAVRKGLV